MDNLLYYLVDKKYSPAKLKRLGYKSDFIKKIIGIMKRNEFKRKPPEIARIDQRKVMVK